MDIIPRSTRRVRYIARPALDARSVASHSVQHRRVPMDTITHRRPTASAAMQPVAPSAVVQQLKPHSASPKPSLIHLHQPPKVHVVPVKTPRPVRPDYEPEPRRKLLTSQKVIYAMAVAVFLAGIGVTMQGLFMNQHLVEQIKALSSASGGRDEAATSQATPAANVPSEEKPKGDYLNSYRVAVQLPRIIRIPKLSVTARVLEVGVDTNNQLQTPKNIYDTAWYNASSKPGEAGAMIVDGHYSGPTTNGVFSKLDRLAVGDEITVERGDGTVFTYVVQSVETKPVGEIDMSKLMVSVNTNIPGLNLITCGGDYDAHTNEFAERTVIYALQK